MVKTPKPTPKPAKAPVAPAPAVAADVTVEFPRNLDKLVTAAGQVTRSGMEIKDQLTALLRQRHAAIEDFIDKKLADGLTLDVIIGFGSIQPPLLPTITTTDGRVSVTWPFDIFIDDSE